MILDLSICSKIYFNENLTLLINYTDEHNLRNYMNG